MLVADLEATVAEVAERGIQGDPIVAVGPAGRKATFTDLDGNRIAIVEVNRPPNS